MQILRYDDSFSNSRENPLINFKTKYEEIYTGQIYSQKLHTFLAFSLAFNYLKFNSRNILPISGVIKDASNKDLEFKIFGFSTMNISQFDDSKIIFEILDNSLLNTSQLECISEGLDSVTYSNEKMKGIIDKNLTQNSLYLKSPLVIKSNNVFEGTSSDEGDSYLSIDKLSENNILNKVWSMRRLNY